MGGVQAAMLAFPGAPVIAPGTHLAASAPAEARRAQVGKALEAFPVAFEGESHPSS